MQCFARHPRLVFLLLLIDRGAWMNPTPGVIVAIIVWLFMITPMIVLLLQQFRD